MFEVANSSQPVDIAPPRVGEDFGTMPHVGAAYCPPDHEAVVGIRVTGVATVTSATMTITSLRRAKILCLSMPDTYGPLWLFTSFKVIDTEMIIGGQATTSTGTASTGVFGSEFVAYSRCANALEGLVLEYNSPITIIATNTSAATQEFRLAILVKPLGSSPNDMG